MIVYLPNENLEHQIDRALSSVGSEHLVYTQRVGGSNPSGPTQETSVNSEVFLIYGQLAQLV